MKRMLVAAIALGAALLTACSLIPREEELRAAPLIPAYSSESFKLVAVVRGDLVLSKKLSLTYVPVKTETLKFFVGGEYYDEVFVATGDVVQKGDLLAQLKIDGMQDAIDQAQLQLKSLQLQRTQLREDRALAERRLGIEGRRMTPEQLAEAQADQKKDFDRREQSLADAIHIQEIQLAEKTDERDRRQLRAGIDGTVTYVRRVREGDLSVSGDRVVTLADSTVSAFRAETELWQFFNPGDPFEISIGKETFAATVVDDESLGLPPAERVEGEKANVYLMLDEPKLDLEDGERGSLVVVLDERKDVLQLPAKAITKANGENIVYYQDEEGMKSLKKVELGLQANAMVEIVKGLSEGESVILE
ncbi:MAG: hypothetical protein GX558_03170 [Clostridiales bacterium]|nr:hypothetical protein [Clostridiales bacterium]